MHIYITNIWVMMIALEIISFVDITVSDKTVRFIVDPMTVSFPA